MHKLIRLMMVVCFISAAALAQSPDARTKAELLLKQARNVVGDEAKLKSLQSLSASGTVRRPAGDSYLEVEVEYDVLLPDKFLRSENPHRFTTSTVIEGDQTYIRRIPTDEVARESDDPRIQARRKAAQHADFSRIMLGWLLTAPPSEEITYSYASESPVAGGTAEMIDAKGRGNFNVRLYLDQQTHRVLMLTFRGKKLTEVMRVMANVPGGPRDPQPDIRKLTPEQLEKLQRQMQADREEWRKQFQAAMAKAPEVERRLVFSDYKSVGGINLPHRLRRYEDGELFEEWTITKFKVNPKFPPAVQAAIAKQ